MVKRKGVVDEIDNLEDIKKDEWEAESEAEEIKESKLKKQKEVEENISEEITVFDYDEEM